MKDIMPIVNTQVRHRARQRLRRDGRVRAQRAARRTRTGWPSPASAAAGARRSSTPNRIPSSRRRARGTAPSEAQANEYTPKHRDGSRRRAQGPAARTCTAAKDAGIPVDQVQKFFAALKAQGTPAELVIYPGRRARLPRRFPRRQLPEGRRRGRLEQDARVVQEIRRRVARREHSVTAACGSPVSFPEGPR